MIYEGTLDAERYINGMLNPFFTEHTAMETLLALCSVWVI
jgi:hypothetical protein